MFEGREYKGSAFFFPLFYGPVLSIRRNGKGEHTLYCTVARLSCILVWYDSDSGGNGGGHRRVL